jgi:hypothetical protein
VSPVKYELGFYIPEDGTLHSHRHENLKSHIATYIYDACFICTKYVEAYGVPKNRYRIAALILYISWAPIVEIFNACSKNRYSNIILLPFIFYGHQRHHK